VEYRTVVSGAIDAAGNISQELLVFTDIVGSDLHVTDEAAFASLQVEIVELLKARTDIDRAVFVPASKDA
jgi:hypothetical protein